MMRCKRTFALLLALCLALSLSACSKEEMLASARAWAEDTIIKLATRMGFRDEDGGDEDSVSQTEATAGGSFAFPEDFDYTAEHLVADLRDGTLYVGFNGIANRSTPYFVAAQDSVTITAYSSSTYTSSSSSYKIALWELSQDQTKTSYVADSTIYFSADGEGAYYTYTIAGLTPGHRYKINISYDVPKNYVTGGMAVSGVSNEELTSIEEEE